LSIYRIVQAERAIAPVAIEPNFSAVEHAPLNSKIRSVISTAVAAPPTAREDAAGECGGYCTTPSREECLQAHASPPSRQDRGLSPPLQGTQFAADALAIFATTIHGGVRSCRGQHHSQA
jgi:hypothetical protein